MPFKDAATKRAYNQHYWKKNKRKLRADHRQYYWNNREDQNAKNKKRWNANSVRYRKANRKWRDRLRQQILDAYGNKCRCCGETIPQFLCVDHVHGGGRKHMKELGGQSNFYLWLRRMKFPKKGFRLLCHNCNFAKGHYGKCPHQLKEK